MTKGIFLSLFFVSLFLLTCGQVRSEEEADMEKMYSTIIEGVEYTIRPKNLCPFTLEVYPKVVHVGDPFYVQLNFRNTTNTDAYAPIRMGIEYGPFALYLSENVRSIIPWHVSGGMGSGYAEHIWKKVKPGEKGPTLYTPIGFPEVEYGEKAAGFYCTGYNKKRWKEIKGWSHEMRNKIDEIANFIRYETKMDELFMMDPYEFYSLVWYGTAGEQLGELDKRQIAIIALCCREVQDKISDALEGVRLGGTAGRLMVVMYEDQNASHQTHVVFSPPIGIKPRASDEMTLLDMDMPFEEREYYTKQDFERIIPKLTPGTLQNLFIYERLLIELEEFIESTSDIDANAETRILEMFAQIGKFLKPLHEIERENLKLSFYSNVREDLRERLLDNGKLQKRLNEVFGAIATPVKIPFGMQGGM